MPVVNISHELSEKNNLYNPFLENNKRNFIEKLKLRVLLYNKVTNSDIK